jgi:hypothetical protein
VQEIKERFVLDEDQVGIVHAVRGFEIFHGFVFVAREGDDRSDKLRLEVLLAGESANWSSKIVLSRSATEGRWVMKTA